MTSRLQQDIKKKRALENEAAKVFGLWYALVMKDIVAKNLSKINSAVKKDLTKKLESLYKKITVGMFHDELAKSNRSDLTALRTEIYETVKKSTDKELTTQVGYIVDSTDKAIKSAIKRAETIKDDDGNKLTGRALIIATLQIVAISFKSKAIMDATTQTNSVAELTRFTIATTETATLVDYAEKVSAGIEVVDKREITPAEYTTALIGGLAIRSTAKKFSKDVVKAGKAGRIATVQAGESPVGANIFTVTAVANQKKISTAIKKFVKAFKSWVNMEDSWVRPTHTGATMAGKILIGDAFEVGAYMMLYPGDWSLGAGVEEIVNCRCALNYI